MAACAACADLTTWAAADIASRGRTPGREGRPFIGQLTPGAQVGRYHVLGAIGRGGMGEVYAAYHPDLDRRIALKVVYAAGAGGSEHAVRLLREARAIARLSHPHVIQVYDAGIVEGGIYIAMEFVAGATLDQWLRAAPRSWREILEVFAAAGRGLVAAHTAGVVHRDFKPQNVMVGRDGSVRVTDFGLARLVRETSDDERTVSTESREEVAASLSVTKTGAVLGTPAYMAPEQFKGAAVDERADQFSFCVALHEALYGVRPSLMHLPTPLTAEVSTDAAPTNAPSRLRSVVRRGLAADREHRYASMNDLLHALDRSRLRLGPRALAVASGLAVLLLLLGGWRFTRHGGGVTCAVPTERLATAWSGRDDARRQSIRRAFLASGRASAEASWQGVSTVLDAHIGQWSAMYIQSCEATHVRGEQSAEVNDLRMSCLNESLDEVRALTDVLVTADSAAVAKASTVARNLAPVSRCSDLDLLRSVVPLPRDSATLQAVQKLRAALRTVRAQGDLGNYWAASTAAKTLRPEVERLGYRPLLAEVLTLIGMGLVDTEPQRAEQILEEALLAAERVGDRETAAQAASALTFVVGYQLGRVSEGKRWARIGEAIVDGLKGNHSRLRGWIANDLGTVLVAEGSCDKARASFQRAITLKREVLGDDHPDVAISLNCLCHALICLGRFSDAVESGDRAVAIVEKNADAEGSFAGVAYANRGRALGKMGRWSEAAADLTRALAMYTADAATMPKVIAESLHGLGEVRLAQHQTPLAVSDLERALSMRERYELDPRLVAETRFALARALWEDGGDRHRARSLAVAARDGYGKGPETAAVTVWLASHSKPKR
jgi:tetratricopeptide (TPR) repeat protein